MDCVDLLQLVFAFACLHLQIICNCLNLCTECAAFVLLRRHAEGSLKKSVDDNAEEADDASGQPTWTRHGASKTATTTISSCISISSSCSGSSG